MSLQQLQQPQEEEEEEEKQEEGKHQQQQSSSSSSLSSSSLSVAKAPSFSLEAYRKRIEDTRRSLKGLGSTPSTSEDVPTTKKDVEEEEEGADDDDAGRRIEAVDLETKAAAASARASAPGTPPSVPTPPPGEARPPVQVERKESEGDLHDVGQEKVSAKPPPTPRRSPRGRWSMVRNIRKLSNASSNSGGGGAAAAAAGVALPPAPSTSLSKENIIGTRMSAMPAMPETSPRTKAKELIGETLSNLRKQAKQWSAPEPEPEAGEGGENQSQNQNQRQKSTKPTKREVLSKPKPRSGPAVNEKGKSLSHGPKSHQVTRLLQDASLLHKKIDAMIESDHNQSKERSKSLVDAEDSKAQFADRLYQSLAKLKHLERSRNKMALCADGMEKSVQSLNQFADQLDLERKRKERLQQEKKKNAEMVIKTNASLLSTEITLLLRSYAVDQKQVEQVKGSINEFIHTVVQQMDQLL